MGVLARFLAVLLIPGAVYATTFGDVADNLMEPTTLITKLVLITCYIVGIALLLMAFAQYKIHRQSPKLVPLSTPITLAILGIIALLIPYATNLFGPSFSATEQNAGQPQEKTILPLPDVNSNKGALVPLPSDTPPPSEPSQPPPAPSKPAPQGGGHWTDDPRFN